MDKQDALKFPRDYGAMSDAQNASHTIQYDEVRRYFLKCPDVECIPLFLNSFGDTQTCAFGVYQLVEDVMREFSAANILPRLQAALRSKSPDVQYWSAQIACNFPDPSLVAAYRSE